MARTDSQTDSAGCFVVDGTAVLPPVVTVPFNWKVPDQRTRLYLCAFSLTQAKDSHFAEQKCGRASPAEVVMLQTKISGQVQVVNPIADRKLALHLESCFRESDPGLLPGALRHIAKLKGFTELSRETGIRRTTLYRLLSIDADPSFSDILKVTRALGFKLRLEPISTLEAPNNECQ